MSVQEMDVLHFIYFIYRFIFLIDKTQIWDKIQRAPRDIYRDKFPFLLPPFYSSNFEATSGIASIVSNVTGAMKFQTAKSPTTNRLLSDSGIRSSPQMEATCDIKVNVG